jgi:hypothetical protein
MIGLLGTYNTGRREKEYLGNFLKIIRLVTD